MARSGQRYARALVFDLRHSNRRRRPKDDYGHQTHSQQQSLSDNCLNKITILAKFGAIMPVANFWFGLEMRRPWVSVFMQKSALVLQFNGNER